MFRLHSDFVEQFKGKQPQWGPLGYVVYKRTYARVLEDGSTEEFWQTTQRVVEGTYQVQEKHCRQLGLPWSTTKAQKSAQEMYQRIWDFKFLPPGRGLWVMGTDILEKKGSAPLANCGFVTTKEISTDFSEPFTWAMEMSMLGVGVGFDTLGAGLITIREPRQGQDVFVIEDSREGWVALVGRILEAYVGRGSLPGRVDYSNIREAGSPLKTFGGIASGPQPLIDLIEDIHSILRPAIGTKITSTIITDLFNVEGRCVVSGNVRRSAMLALGLPEDNEFIELKDPRYEEQLLHHRWASNNSVLVEKGQNYGHLAELTAKNGEPGYMWLHNARKYSRMGNDEGDWKDAGAMGANPCLPKWARLLTRDGIRNLEEVNIGTDVWTETGWAPVTNKWSTGIKPVYKFTTTAGIFYGTNNHRVISNGVKIEVGEADSIDQLVGPYLGPQVIISQAVMDGLMIGDGSVHGASNNLPYLIVGKEDHDYFESEIANLIVKDRSGIHDGAWEVVSTIVATELPKTYLRKVPTRYVEANIATKASFLRGLYSANGSICGGRVTLKASSLSIIEDVQTMLSSLGIKSYRTLNKEHDVEFGNGVYTCKESYDLNITVDRLRFRELIGFIQADKTERLNEACRVQGSSKKSTYDIISVEHISNEEVFDITVDNDPHTFWTQGLNVSNCAEQVLWPFELCTLVETFPSRHDSLDDYKRTLKFAYLYGKTTTLIPTHNQRTNAIMMKNRRIGTSISGIVQAMQKLGRREFLKWCDEGYQYIRHLDEVYSDWFCIPRSIKVTTVKPSGTVSNLPGVTPGIHFPHSEYYLRTIRFQDNSPMVDRLRKAKYRIEVDAYSPNTVVVYFPVREQFFDRSKAEVSLWEQLELAAQIQHYWSDNAVSITVTFKPDEAHEIAKALELYETRLKTVSFLPLEKHGYVQAPYQSISQAEYMAYSSALKDISWSDMDTHDQVDQFCDGEVCMLPTVG